jgi:hypothetical protein
MSYPAAGAAPGGALQDKVTRESPAVAVSPPGTPSRLCGVTDTSLDEGPRSVLIATWDWKTAVITK